MRSKTKAQILEFISENGPSKVIDICSHLALSPQAIHRHLKQMLHGGELKKSGRPPVVFYQIETKKKRAFNFPELPSELSRYLEQRYSYMSPTGSLVRGEKGFQQWAVATQQEKSFSKLAAIYKKKAEDLESLREGNLLKATTKVQSSLPDLQLDELLYKDYWSLPQFGRSHLGNLLTMGKSGQKREAIKELAEACRADLKEHLKKEKFDAIAFAPHSIPRKLVFLKTFENFLELNYPKLHFLKALSDGVPVAQKSLSKMSERVLNARETIFLKEGSVEAKKVLIIDDAVGSGATLNEMARKIKGKGVQQVSGFAIVGSLKGFDILSEI